MLFLLMTGFVAAYEPVRGIDFPQKTTVEEYNFYHDISLRFTVNRQNNTGYNNELLYRAIVVSSAASFKEIQSLGAIEKRCTPNDILEIFEIREDQLNSPNRFPEQFIGTDENGRDPLWGYFDPRMSEPGYNAIVVSPHSPDSNYRVLVHEVAHHWYATFCLERYTSLTSEEFAVEIQKKATWN